MKPQADNDEIEIDLKALLFYIARRWWLLLICILAGAALALGATRLLITPKYQSDAMIYILGKATSLTSVANIQLGDALSADFTVIAKSKPVLDGALEKLDNYDLDRKELAEITTVENLTDTRILKISVTDPDAKLARDAANAIADQTAQQMAFIMQTDPPTTIEKAEAAKTPVSPSLKKNTMIGMLAGFVLAAGFATFRFLTNDRITSTEDLENSLGINTLAVLPLDEELDGDKFYKKDRKHAKHQRSA